MKIIICASISVWEEVLRVKKDLEERGFEVEIPEGVKTPEIQTDANASSLERADIKIKYDLIRGYYEKMKNYDMILIVNPEKNGTNGYIGGNTFIEMAFAHILNKPLFCLYPLPDMPYSSEMLAMQPIILNGNLDLIKKVNKTRTC